MKNIVLTGLPGSGKTALGVAAARARGMAFIDTDELAVEHDGRSISEIFAQSGEAAFRDLESAMAKKAAAMENTVISTGGGMVLRSENMLELRKSGIVVFIDRDPELIAADVDCGGRPLLEGGAARVLELSAQRRQLYLESADIVYANNGTFERGLEGLLAAIYYKLL